MVKFSYKNVLILTATIRPKPGVPNLMRSNPADRLADYEKTLGFYLEFIGNELSSIIFVDNSNYDLSSLKKIVEDRGVLDQVFFLSFDGLDYPPHYDRGYGEMMMLDYVMNHECATKIAADTVFWKSTGRYTIENFAEIVNTYPANTSVYCNMRDLPRKLVDMYLMAWTQEGYIRILEGKYKMLATSSFHIEKKIHPEELLRMEMPKNHRRERISPRFKITPKISGIRAGDNNQYSTTGRWKYPIRSTMNTLLPFIWI